MTLSDQQIVKEKGSFLSEGVKINYLIYLPKSEASFPAFIFHPGNRLFPEDYEWLHYELVKHGYIVMGLYQRGYGSGEDGVNDRAGTIQQNDLLNGLKHLKELAFVQTDQIGVIGHSNGAGMSLKLAATHREIKCVVSLSMISNWLEFIKRVEYHLPEYYQVICEEFGGPPKSNPEEYESRSCIQFAQNIKIPVLLVSGSDDAVTPSYQSKWMYDALVANGNESVNFKIIPEVGHFYEKYSFSGYKTKFVADAIVEWVRKFL